MKILTTCYAFVLLSASFISSCSKTESTASSNLLNAKGSSDGVELTGFASGDSTVIRGDTTHGDQSALIQSRKSPNLRDSNYVGFPAFSGEAWTWDGVVGNERSLMTFSLDRIPPRIRRDPPAITKVLLYLYQYQRNDGLDIYGVEQTMLNEVEIHRIQGNWASNTVTWNHQPKLASGSVNPLEDMITIPAISTPLAMGVKDDIVVDITDMIRRMITDDTNKGFLLKLTEEEESHPYCGRSFGSFTCPLNGKKPRLVVYY